VPEPLRVIERVDRRVLGAVRLVDAVTGRPILRPLSVAADGSRFLRNRAGLYVIREAPGLDAHVTEFQTPPAAPAPGAAGIERLRIDDPLGQYLPRLARVPLPRAPLPAAGEPDLFQPEDVAMLPAPAASPRLDWGGWRARVLLAADESPFPGALLALDWASPTGVLFRARGLSDARGEALVPVAGLPVSRPGQGPNAPPLVDETVVTLSVFARAERPWPVDPDALERLPALGAVSVEPVAALRLRAGRLVPVVVRLTF
jgi:hypothetical protein